MSDLPPIPLIVRTRLAHATLQAIADACGADLLHIKGAAVDPSLLPTRPDAPADAPAWERVDNPGPKPPVPPTVRSARYAPRREWGR